MTATVTKEKREYVSIRDTWNFFATGGGTLMTIAKVVFKEIIFFIIGPLIIMGVAGIIDFFRDRPIDWEERIFMSILTVIMIRLLMWGRIIIDKRES